MAVYAAVMVVVGPLFGFVLFFAQGSEGFSFSFLSILLVASITSIILGLLVWREHPKAIVFNKSYLWAMLFAPHLMAIAIVFPDAYVQTSLAYEFGASLLPSLIFFAIWYPVLSSQRAKNTFPDTKTGFMKGALLYAIILLASFVGLIIGAALDVLTFSA